MRACIATPAAVAVWLVLGGLAAAQDAPSFPPAFDRDSLLLWLGRQTDIAPDQVLAVTPQALTAKVSLFPAGNGHGPRLVVRAEALDAESYERAGALSWHVSVNVDCVERRVQLGETMGYRSRNLLGDRRVLRPAETEWRTPTPGTALESVWRAACETGFNGPFSDAGVKVADVDGPQPPADAKPTPVEPPAQQTTAPRAAGAAPPSSGPVAQVGAASSEAEASALLAKLARQIAGRPQWVETATVKGRVWRRALVGGFANTAEATRFCTEVKASGGACFVRPSRVR